MFNLQFPKKLGAAIFLILIAVVISPMMFGVNDAGHRTVIQYLNGTLYVKFSPGLYVKWFGTKEVYNDVITFDFDKTDAKGDAATIDQKGIPVRYQDGGTGIIYGKSRYSLPGDAPTMIKLHKAFRSNEGVAQKLIKAVTEEGENLTAGLMTSEEAYATKRGIFTQWSHEQIAFGKFQTELKEIITEDEVTGKKVIKTIPEIKYGEDGRPLQFESDFDEYGVSVSGYQITDWDFEPKTLTQIATKREATMAIITAKANAERAKQDAITAEEQGKANVMTAKYEKEVEKQKAVVDAQREQEVAVIAAERQVKVAEQQKKEAVIKAQQKVDVAAQQKLEAEQKKLTANEYKQEQTLRGEGDATYKRLVLEADGALAQKLETYENVMSRFAQEFGKQKWVPEVQMGSSSNTGGEGSDAASNLITLLTAKTLKDLGLDMSISQGAVVSSNLRN